MSSQGTPVDTQIAFNVPGVAATKESLLITATTVAAAAHSMSIAFSPAYKTGTVPTILSARTSSTYGRNADVKVVVDNVTATGASVTLVGGATASLPDADVAVEVIHYGNRI